LRPHRRFDDDELGAVDDRRDSHDDRTSEDPELDAAT
jgi:hypothetical protein